MPTSRTYGDACAIARALDIVGERWALLVVRELFLGPQRFSDLRRALPKAASNVVTDRLRELEGHGVVARRTLPPPAASTVYELTAWGRELEPIVLALGGWALDVPPTPEATLSATSVLLYLRGAARPDAHAPETVCQVNLDDRPWTVTLGRGRLAVEPGECADPDATLRTDPSTLNALLDDPAGLEHAVSRHRASVTGDESALRRILNSVA
jgi:DNA-binding HxlR family transcriptional regulator